jgi:hypothetical protein
MPIRRRQVFELKGERGQEVPTKEAPGLDQACVHGRVERLVPQCGAAHRPDSLIEVGSVADEAVHPFRPGPPRRWRQQEGDDASGLVLRRRDEELLEVVEMTKDRPD